MDSLHIKSNNQVNLDRNLDQKLDRFIAEIWTFMAGFMICPMDPKTKSPGGKFRRKVRSPRENVDIPIPMTRPSGQMVHNISPT